MTIGDYGDLFQHMMDANIYTSIIMDRVEYITHINFKGPPLRLC